MASRPVFMSRMSAPYFEVVSVDFSWNSGLAKSQKQKNIVAIHQEFQRKRPDHKVLEISSKSLQEYGDGLSAFNMKKLVPELGRSVPVECIYQGGKVFRYGGPFKDLMEGTSRAAKKDERLKNSGPLVGFTFEGKEIPLNPQNAFYDYLYMNALLENPELMDELLKYDAFTDIEFNPNKSINCQARAAAEFVSLYKLGLVDQIKDLDSFLALIGRRP